ncbi:MAG: ABC transporter permease [Phaeodactylibacter sp.]|nr:ABC transporter permease [Phaeodactylibacter sp.]MCB9053933.1 ABC transporter permease [Lewinellaceae bacterium]
MIRNYLKLAYRNLMANKMVSAINILGLSIATGCSIVVFLFLQNYWTMDNFHLNGERIFMVEYTVDKSGREQTWGTSPMPLGPVLATDFPQVEEVVRVEMQGCKVYLGENAFEELAYFADPGYFDMFTFPLKSGSPEVINEPDAVILSASVADKYFNGEEAIGQELTIVFENQVRKVLTVGAVAEEFPENTGFRFGLLTGFNTLKSIGKEGLTDWASHVQSTFVMVRQPEDIDILEERMDKYVALHNAANQMLSIQSFRFDNLRHPNPGAHDVINRPAEAAHPIVTLMFSLMALLMMALSCFNYVNISLGFVGKRLKEIGVRKAIGGRRMQLAGQFMSENLLLCFLSLLLGLALAQGVFAPLLNSVMVMQISISMGENLWLWVFLFGLLVFTGLASGAYPSFYISSFQPVSIFSGRQKLGGKKGLARVLLGAQYVLAFSTVIIGMLLLAAGNYWVAMPWGYQPGQTLMVRLDNAGQYQFLKNKAERCPQVLGVAGSASHIGESQSMETLLIGGEEHDVVRYDVGAGYFEALGLRLKEGRFFDPLLPSEDVSAVVVNETFVKEHQVEDPLGQEAWSDGKPFRIVGVAEDFKIMGSGANHPVIFRLAEEKAFAYMAIRHESGMGKVAEGFMKNAWLQLYPETPFNYFHQEAVFEGFYQSFGDVAKLFGYIAGLALFIACLGLFGLATQNFASILKEASIRKVLGATTASIILLANRGFLLTLFIASLIATAACFLGFSVLVKTMEAYIGTLNLGVGPYLLAYLLVFLAAGIAVGGQSYRLARMSPVEALKSE